MRLTKSIRRGHAINSDRYSPQLSLSLLVRRLENNYSTLPSPARPAYTQNFGRPVLFLVSQKPGAQMATLPSMRALLFSVPIIILAQWLLKLFLGYKRIQRRTNYHPGRWAFLSRSTYYWHLAPEVPLFKWGWHARWVEKFKRRPHSQYSASFTYTARSSSIL